MLTLILQVYNIPVPLSPRLGSALAGVSRLDKCSPKSNTLWFLAFLLSRVLQTLNFPADVSQPGNCVRSGADSYRLGVNL